VKLKSDIPSVGVTLEKAIDISVVRALIKYPDLKKELEEIRNHIRQIAFHSALKTKKHGNG